MMELIGEKQRLADLQAFDEKVRKQGADFDRQLAVISADALKDKMPIGTLIAVMMNNIAYWISLNDNDEEITAMMNRFVTMVAIHKAERDQSTQKQQEIEHATH